MIILYWLISFVVGVICGAVFMYLKYKDVAKKVADVSAKVDDVKKII
jgi:uncharacterized membrane-anchored protein YhcB (DUF1043 family)